MQVINHPFFETLYVDPDEGLYWHQEMEIFDKSAHVAVYVEEAELVTETGISFAEEAITQREFLAGKAKKALIENFTEQPQGVCARYIEDHLAKIDLTDIADVLSLPYGKTLTAHNFIEYMIIDIFAVYPSEELCPLIIEFTISEELTDAVLSVNFTPDKEVAIIEYLD